MPRPSAQREFSRQFAADQRADALLPFHLELAVRDVLLDRCFSISSLVLIGLRMVM